MNLRKIPVLLMGVIFSLIMAGCGEDQSSLSIESINDFATIKGKVVYSPGQEFTDGKYIIDKKAAPRAGLRVFVEVNYSAYKSGATGVKIFEGTIGAGGEYSIQVPVVSTGIQAKVRLEEFEGQWTYYDKMVGGQPQFKSKDTRYYYSEQLSLQPKTLKLKNIEYQREYADQLVGYDEQVLFTGNVKLLYEKGFKDGAEKNAEGANVQFHVVYPDQKDYFFGATTDASGNYSINIPVKKRGDQLTVTAYASSFLDTQFNHYATPGNATQIGGIYYTSNMITSPVQTEAVEGVNMLMGTLYMAFNPLSPAPESWTKDLAGWVKINEYNQKASVSGTLNMAKETAFKTGSYDVAGNKMVKVSIRYSTGMERDFVVSTNSAGEYKFTVPLKLKDEAFTVVDVFAEAFESVDFKHYTNMSGVVSTLSGTYRTGVTPENVLISPSGLDNVIYVLGNTYMNFTPFLPTPETWTSNLAGWFRIADYTKFVTMSGKIKLAVESGFGQGKWGEGGKCVVSVMINSGSPIEVATNNYGEYQFDYPVADPKYFSGNISVSPQTYNGTFEHYRASGSRVTLDGEYRSANNIYNRLISATSGKCNISDAYMMFYPEDAPSTWNPYLPGWSY